MEQYNVFISYSRKDSEKVLSVVKKLQDRGFTIWIDKDGIESGDSFKSVIVHAIKNSDIFLFFSSKDSNASSWTVKEVNTAVHLKKSIIPVRLDDTDYDDSILFDLGSLDFVDLSSEEKREAALNKLINTLLRKSVPLEMGVEINNVDEYDTSLLADDCYNQGVLSFESQNCMEAADWFKKAANKGHSRAQCFLGYLYENGIGVEKSDIEAVNWYAKAAEQGETLAQNNLGSMYREGKGVQRNVDEAARWFRVAAGQGHVLAQYNLAIMYQIGAGVKQDEAEAVKWYREAANQGLFHKLNTVWGICTELGVA